MEKHKVIALLTGRGNNTLKDKNILPVLGRPLLQYPALAAKYSGVVDDYFVSSDDPKILAAAKDVGYQEIIRPLRLAQPDSLHIDVIDHAVEWLEGNYGDFDVLIVLMANTVMVKSEWIKDCVTEIFRDPTLTTVAPVYKEMDHHPFRCKALDEDGNLVPFFDFKGKTISTNRQELPPAYFLCHNFWVLNLKAIDRSVGLAPWTFMGDKVKPYPVDKAFDVHTEDDLKECEAWLQYEGISYES